MNFINYLTICGINTVLWLILLVETLFHWKIYYVGNIITIWEFILTKCNLMLIYEKDK